MEEAMSDIVKSKATAYAFEHKENTAALPVEFLFSLTGWPTKTPAEVKDGPMGHRLFYDVEKGHFEGPKLRGELVRPMGDWATQHYDGTKRLDVRLVIRTSDGVDIFMEYKGLINGEKIHVGGLFQVGHEKYNWLNSIQYIGLGRRNPDGSLTYMFYGLS
jgi:hypothetical protein